MGKHLPCPFPHFNPLPHAWEEANESLRELLLTMPTSHDNPHASRLLEQVVDRLHVKHARQTLRAELNAIFISMASDPAIQHSHDITMERLNNRPRKRLGYQTPNPVFFKSSVALHTWIREPFLFRGLDQWISQIHITRYENTRHLKGYLYLQSSFQIFSNYYWWAIFHFLVDF